jgi:predicted PurR-regulated permease PerM
MLIFITTLLVITIFLLLICRKNLTIKSFKSFFSDKNSNNVIDGIDEVTEDVREIKDEVSFRVKRVKQEVSDIGKAIKEVGNQVGDISDAAEGKKRRGRKPKKK